MSNKKQTELFALSSRLLLWDAPFLLKGGFAEIENGVDYNVNTHKNEPAQRRTHTHTYVFICLIELGYIALLLGAVKNLAYFVLISGWQIVFLFRLGFFRLFLLLFLLLLLLGDRYKYRYRYKCSANVCFMLFAGTFMDITNASARLCLFYCWVPRLGYRR